MKTKRYYSTVPFLFFSVILLLLQGCGAARITFDVLTPAPVTIPGYIQKIALMNRSAGANEDLDRLEAFLTGEGKDRDRIPAQFVLDGLSGSLQNNTQFTVVRIPEIMKGSATGNQFPAPLPWNVVSGLCKKYGAGALIALESYDSDFLLTPDVGGTISGENPEASGMATIHCGFRFYDPKSRTIIDEFGFRHTHAWNPGLGLVISTVIMLKQKPKVIREASITAGRVYAERITSAWFKVSRDYFKKGSGNPDLGLGARMMEANNWDEAITALERAVNQGSRKSRGRAAHNLAVVYEILGDLQQAKDWASVAWGQYKEKKSKEYGYILTNRINEQEILNHQLKD
ncbi:MAG: tetratricopeptide repeat protein [Chlorobi bacterium]|nr:tetratricopeptide repeat protein [Chlorobiota bacterium]